MRKFPNGGNLRLRLGAVIGLALAPCGAHADPSDAQERQQVLKIFDLLMSTMDLSERDRIGPRIESVFPREWEESWRTNAKGEKISAFRPGELLPFQEALDPRGQKPEMFCDDRQRDQEAQTLARSSSQNVWVSSVRFSYPIFGSRFKTATVYFKREEKLVFPGGKRDLPDADWGRVRLRQQRGVWTCKISVEGMT